MFEQAKEEYKQACSVLINLMKITKDDEKFHTYLSGHLNYALEKAEVCKKNMTEALKSKNSAGFYNNNLTISAFQ
jgi:hypothetical protein